MMDVVTQPTTLSHSSNNSNNKNETNFDLKTYFQQLAIANGVKGFCLVSDNALCPRYDMKRISSAPPTTTVMNGATRKFLTPEEDAAPSYPSRRRSSGVETLQRGSLLRWEEHSNAKGGGEDRRKSDGELNSNNKLDNYSSLLETVLDQVDSILYEEDEDEEDDDDHSIDSQEVATSCDMEEHDLRFDSNFRRFSVNPNSAHLDKAPLNIHNKRHQHHNNYTMAQQQQRNNNNNLLPRLPVRQMSVDDFSKDGATTLSSGDSIISTTSTDSFSVSIGTNQTFEMVPGSPVRSSFAVCVPIEETTSWHEEDDEEDDDDDDDQVEDVTEVEDDYNDLKEEEEEEKKGSNETTDIPPPPPVQEEIQTPDAQTCEHKEVLPTTIQQEQQYPASAPTMKRTLHLRLDNDLELRDMLEPPPLDDPSPAVAANASRFRRRSRRRRSSLDTGHTFRNSFGSSSSSSLQTTNDNDDKDGCSTEEEKEDEKKEVGTKDKPKSSRWD